MARTTRSHWLVFITLFLFAALAGSSLVGCTSEMEGPKPTIASDVAGLCADRHGVAS